LRRCGFRCPITKLVDKLSPDKPPGAYPVTLEGAHIIPHHLSEAKTEIEVSSFYMSFIVNLKKEQKRKVWQALGTFAGPEIRGELNGQNIDALDNIIILQHDNHVAFGKMDMWFTADEVRSPFPFLLFLFTHIYSPTPIDIE
jgi:hypothetical protein